MMIRTTGIMTNCDEAEKQPILHLLIKPTHACNLRCKHCYHAEKGYDAVKLSLDDIDKVLTLAAKEYKKVDVIWHGGEPMLMGIQFYEGCFKIEEKIKQEYGTKFQNSIQTNATLINEEWIEFCEHNELHIGISYDGIFNDSLREQTEKVTNAIQLMRNKDYHFGCICVVTSENVNKLLDMYKWFNEQQISCKFNPIFASGAAKNNTEFLLDPVVYANNVVSTFKYWLHDEKCTISISSFDNYIHEAIGIGGRVCSNASCLFTWLCIDAYGDFYPCGKPHEKKFCFGNIKDTEAIQSIFESQNYTEMAKLMVELRAKCIEKCDVVRYCQGGCPAERMYTEDNNAGWICVTTKIIWHGIIDEILKFVDDLYSNNLSGYNPIIARRVSKLLKIKHDPNNE